MLERPVQTSPASLTASASRRAEAAPLAPFRQRPAIALHHQIKEDLFLKLRSGDWPPGFELPSEEALCAHYAVSRGTVRRAVADLVAEGYIERHRGRGSFVCQPKLESGVVGAYNRFSVVGPRLDPGGRVLFCRKARASRQVATVLQIDPGDPVWHFERVRFTDGHPMSVQTSFMPVAMCPELVRKDLATHHLVELLRERHGIHLGSATETIDPTVADAWVARHLDIRVGTPLFQIERTTCTLSGAVAEYRHAVLRGDVYRYRIELR